MSAIRQSLVYCSVAAVLGIVTTVYPNDLQTSKAGLELIASYENCVSCTYKDSIGKNTIGIGSTRSLDGKPVPDNQQLSNDSIARLFVRDIKEAEDCVITYLNGKKMPQPVFDSTVSLVYNNGCYGTRWNRSANRPTFIARYAVSGDWNNVCYRLGDFINAGGVRNQGLVNRRTAEQRQCLQYRQ